MRTCSQYETIALCDHAVFWYMQSAPEEYGTGYCGTDLVLTIVVQVPSTRRTKHQVLPYLIAERRGTNSLIG